MAGGRALDDPSGLDALTALAFGLIIGTPERFARSKELSSYLGLVPTEDSSGERRPEGLEASPSPLNPRTQPSDFDRVCP